MLLLFWSYHNLFSHKNYSNENYIHTIDCSAVHCCLALDMKQYGGLATKLFGLMSKQQHFFIMFWNFFLC